MDISKPIVKGGLIAEHIFEDKTKMIIVWDERKKWVVDHWEEYLSPRNKYINIDGSDLQYSYKDYYEKAENLAMVLVKMGKCIEDVAREEVFKLIFEAWKIRFYGDKGVTTSDIDSIKKLMEKWKWGLDLYAEKVLFSASFGFHSEDEYLKYPLAKIRIGRDFNLVKYFIVLIGDKELVNTESGRMTPIQASILWNKDGLKGDEKKKRIDTFMARIRKKFDPTYRDIESAWG